MTSLIIHKVEWSSCTECTSHQFLHPAKGVPISSWTITPRPPTPCHDTKLSVNYRQYISSSNTPVFALFCWSISSQISERCLQSNLTTTCLSEISQITYLIEVWIGYDGTSQNWCLDIFWWVIVANHKKHLWQGYKFCFLMDHNQMVYTVGSRHILVPKRD